MHHMNEVRMLEFVQRGNEREHLLIVEGMRDIPFGIECIFYIYGSNPNVVKGQHINKNSEFVLINVAEKSKVRVKDGEGNEAIYCLGRLHTGIYLPTIVWKELYDFSSDSVLLVLASTHYDPVEYIRDYDEFVQEIGGHNGKVILFYICLDRIATACSSEIVVASCGLLSKEVA